MNHLKLIALKDFPLVKPLDNLPILIIESIKLNKIDIEDGDVFIIAQKIVSKSENRYKNIKCNKVYCDSRLDSSTGLHKF